MRFLILCCFFFIVFCSLGVWQLHRYHYKKDLLTQYQEKLSASPLPFLKVLEEKSGDSLQFQSVIVEGEYVNALTMLLQHQFYHDHVGFDVITPLRIPGQKKLLLVDRGWISLDNKPLLLTEPRALATGYLKLLNEYQFTLGPIIIEQNTAPLIIQKIDIKAISQKTHESFYPFVLRLSANSPNGFVRDWTIIAGLPERHLAYAIQWFAMALILAIAYVIFCIKQES